MITTVTSRQSLFDIALQHCGIMEAAFDIAQANGISLTDDLTTGQTLTLPEPTDTSMVQHYTTNNIQPATAITNSEINDLLAIGEGIGFWAIEYDFVVS